jgi:hypothetical protein
MPDMPPLIGLSFFRLQPSIRRPTLYFLPKKKMGAVSRVLMTTELMAASILLLLIASVVFAKMRVLCPDKTTNKDCQRSFLNGLLICAVIVGLFGGGLSLWKMGSKVQEIANTGQN